MSIARKPYIQYMSKGQSLIQIFKNDSEGETSSDSFNFRFQVLPSETHPDGVYQESGFKTAMKCLTASESAYSRFFKLPKQGGWK